MSKMTFSQALSKVVKTHWAMYFGMLIGGTIGTVMNPTTMAMGTAYVIGDILAAVLIVGVVFTLILTLGYMWFSKNNRRN